MSGGSAGEAEPASAGGCGSAWRWRRCWRFHRPWRRAAGLRRYVRYRSAVHAFPRPHRRARHRGAAIRLARQSAARFRGGFRPQHFRVPLDERRRRLLGIDWVEDASVSRIWPDRLVVRIRERKPVAFVLFRSRLAADRRAGRAARPAAAGAVHVSRAERRARRRNRGASAASACALLLQVEEELGHAGAERLRGERRRSRRISGSWPRWTTARWSCFWATATSAGAIENFLSHYARDQTGSPEVKTFDLRLDDRITAKE